MASLIRNVKHFGKISISARLTSKQKDTAIIKKGQSRSCSYRGVDDKFYHPSQYEKRIMAFTRVYPSMEVIPKTVSYNAVLKAKDRMRIVMAFGMIGLTLIAYQFIFHYSRKLRDEGDGVMKRTFEWQRNLAARREHEHADKDVKK